MKRFNKVYLEISNVCNLKCAFCPGTKRKSHIMTEEEFSALCHHTLCNDGTEEAFRAKCLAFFRELGIMNAET